MKKNIFSLFFAVLCLMMVVMSSEIQAQTQGSGSTDCQVLALPCNFDAEGTFSTHPSGGSESFPQCWESIDAVRPTSYWKSKTGGAHGGNQSFYFFGVANPKIEHNDWLITPAIAFTGHEEISFWVKTGVRMATPNFTAHFAIYASNASASSITDTANFDQLAISGANITSNIVTFASQDWINVTVALPSSVTGDCHLAFVVKDISSYNFYLDDISIYTASSCATPSDVVLTSLGATSASFEWNSDASLFSVYCDVNGTEFSNIIPESANENQYTMTGLLPNTTYSMQVSAMCDDGAESNPSNPIVFTTACTPISNGDFPFYEDFSDNEVGASKPLDACWYKGTNSTMKLPYVKTGKGRDDDTSLYFMSKSAEYSYAVLPLFEEAVNNLSFSCSIWRSETESKTSAMSIGLMSVPSDINTFVPFDTLAPTTPGQWEDFTISLADFVADSGLYIAMMLPKGMLNEAYVDNIRVELDNACATPSNPIVKVVTDATAQIEWEDASGSAWRVYYGALGFDTTGASHVDVDTTMALISGLNAQTEYEYMVLSNCGEGGLSYPTIRASFTTSCAAVVTLPYAENFEAYGAGENATINPCWTKVCTKADEAYPYPDSVAAINGNRGLMLRALKTAMGRYESYVALPMFEENLNQLDVTFKMKNNLDVETHHSNTYARLAVGVMSNPQDISTFDTVQIFDMIGMADNTVLEQELAFNRYEGEGRYIAFMVMIINNGTDPLTDNVIYLDDIEVKMIPECQTPSNLVVSSKVNDTMTLTWEGNSRSYEVKYSTNADLSDSTVVTAQGNSIQLTNLASYTDYYINVRALCIDGSKSNWMINPVKVRSAMNCGANYQNFVDTIGDGLACDRYSVLNGNDANTNAHNWTIFTASEMAEMGLVSDTNKIHSISLQTRMVGDPLAIRIYMAETSMDAFAENLSDTMALSQMTLVYDHTKQFVANSWNELILDTPFEYDGEHNLMIAFERNAEIASSTEFYYAPTMNKKSAYAYQASYGGSANTTSVRGNMAFNICGYIPSCVRPYGIAITELTSDSVSLAWQGTASSYQVVYATADFNPESITNQTSITVTTNTPTIKNLTPNATYYIYVRSVCENENSLWSQCIVVNTPCDAVALPYSENFDSYPAGTSPSAGQTINPCWVKGSNDGTTAYPYLTTKQAVSESNSMYFNATDNAYSYAALPMFSDSLSNVVMTFNLYIDKNTYRGISVGVMTNPHDANTFTEVATVKPSEEKTWENFEVDFSTYEGNGQFIAFMLQRGVYSYAYLDDVEVFHTPSCPAPIQVTASEITANSAKISWTDRAVSPAGGYELQYGVSGFDLGTGNTITTSTNPVVLTGLNAATDYDVYVRAICADDDEGRWSAKRHFSTVCGAIALPITYNFENYEAGKNADIPTCFYRYNDATSAFNQTNPYINNLRPETGAHEGSQYLYFQMQTFATAANQAAMIFPAIDTVAYPMNGNQVSFWAKAHSTAELVFGLVSNPDNIASFEAIDTINLNNTYTRYTLAFDNYTGNGNYPTFMMYKGTASQTVYIDEVVFDEIPACATASDLHVVSVTGNSAEVAWTDTIGTTKWIVEYHEADSTRIQSVAAMSNPFTITGLTPSTEYSFNVRPVCASGDTTNHALQDGKFWTSQTPVTLPYNYNFEEATEWANWQTNSNCTANWNRGSAVASQGTNSIYLSNDGGATRGSLWNATVNAVAYRDIDFGSDSAAYVLNFKASVGGESDNNIALAVMLVDPFEEVNASQVEKTTPWGPIEGQSLLTISQDTTWNRYYVTLENVTGVKRLAFYWFNPNTGSGNPYSDKSAAIDEISIVEQTCARPIDLNVTNIDATAATLNWSGEATEYEVSYRELENATASTSVQTVQGTTLTINNLLSNTTYAFSVRAICGVGDTSYASDAYHFTTICARYVALDTIRENFNDIAGVRYSENGELPDCWDAYAEGAKGVTPHVIPENHMIETNNGNSLIMTAGANQFYGNHAVVRLPYTEEAVNTLTLIYSMTTESNVNGKLEVGYLTGEDMATDFVAVKTIPASASTRDDMGGGINDTVSFASVPDSAEVVALRWSYVVETGMASVSIDDVELYATIVCHEPEIESLTADYESATIAWNGTAANYQLIYKEHSASDWSDTITTAETQYTFTNLNSETEYQVRLRAMCGEDGNSDWIDTLFTTTIQPCHIPTNLTAEASYDQVTLDWEVEGPASQWAVKVFNSNDTIIDTVESKPATIAGLYAGIEYRAIVKSLCANNHSSEWSDTLVFSTTTCPIVSGVEATEITNNVATISWNAGDASKWELAYGIDIDLDEGTIVEITEATYTLTNLTEATQYDVYVRQYCAESIYGPWSEKLSFTTLSGQEGIDGVGDKLHCHIYPNPTTGATTISLQGVEGKVSISIVDMNGRTLKVETIECGSDCEKRIDVDGLSQGTYFVRILGNDVNSVRKLIVR